MDQHLVHGLDAHTLQLVLKIITPPVIILPQIHVAIHTFTQIAQPAFIIIIVCTDFKFQYVADVLLMDMEWLLTTLTSYVPNVSHKDGFCSYFCNWYHFGL